MNLEDKYLERLNLLIDLANQLVANEESYSTQSNEDFGNIYDLNASSHQFVLDLYGIDSAYYRSITEASKNTQFNSLPSALKGILNGIKRDIERGYVANLKNQMSQEFSGDYLEMATHLNNREGLHIAAAVITGTTLEERVRQLARKHLGSDCKPDGSPEKLEMLNTKLRDFYSGTLADQRQVTLQYGLRNEAAHGAWNLDKDEPRKKELHLEQVKLMITSVNDFIHRNPI